MLKSATNVFVWCFDWHTQLPNKCFDGVVVNDVDVLWFFAGSTPMPLNFYMDLIRPTIMLEISIQNIHQGFPKNTSNSIRKRLMDPKKILNFYTEGDQGSLGVFRGPPQIFQQSG